MASLKPHEDAASTAAEVQKSSQRCKEMKLDFILSKQPLETNIRGLKIAVQKAEEGQVSVELRRNPRKSKLRPPSPPIKARVPRRRPSSTPSPSHTTPGPPTSDRTDAISESGSSVKRRKVDPDPSPAKVIKLQRLIIKPPKPEYKATPARTIDALFYDFESSDSEVVVSGNRSYSPTASTRLTPDGMSKRKLSFGSDTGDSGFDPTIPPKDPTELAIWICGNINALRAHPYEHTSENSSPTTPTKKRTFNLDVKKDDITLAKEQEKRDHAKMRKAKSRGRPANWLQNKKNDVRTRVNSNGRAKYGIGTSLNKDAYMTTQFADCWRKVVERARERISAAVSRMKMFQMGFDETVFPRDDVHHLVSDGIGRLILRALLSVGNSEVRPSGVTAVKNFHDDEFANLSRDALMTAFEVLAGNADVQDALDVIFRTIYTDRDRSDTGSGQVSPVAPVKKADNFIGFTPAEGSSRTTVRNSNVTTSLNGSNPVNGVNGTSEITITLSEINGPAAKRLKVNPGFSNKPTFKMQVPNNHGNPSHHNTPSSQASGMLNFRLNGFQRSKPTSDRKAIAATTNQEIVNGRLIPAYQGINSVSSVSATQSLSPSLKSVAVHENEVDEEGSRGRLLTRGLSRLGNVVDDDIDKGTGSEQRAKAGATDKSHGGVDSRIRGEPAVNTIISTAEGQAASELYRRHTSSAPPTPTLTNGGSGSSNSSSAAGDYYEPIMRHYSKSEYYWYKAPHKFPGTRLPSPSARLRSFREKEMDEIYGYPPAPGAQITIDMSKIKVEVKKTDDGAASHEGDEQPVLRSGRNRRSGDGVARLSVNQDVA